MKEIESFIENRVISKEQRLHDLTSPDFFLWGMLKRKVYCNNPRTLVQLKDNIQQEIYADIPDMLEAIFHNME